MLLQFWFSIILQSGIYLVLTFGYDLFESEAQHRPDGTFSNQKKKSAPLIEICFDMKDNKVGRGSKIGCDTFCPKCIWSPSIWSPTIGPQLIGPSGQMVPNQFNPHGQLVPKNLVSLD